MDDWQDVRLGGWQGVRLGGGRVSGWVDGRV